MKINKSSFWILSFLMITSYSIAQNLSISEEFGVAFKTNSFSNGYAFNINAFLLHSGNHHLGLTLGNIFMSSSNLLPGKRLDEYNFHLRDCTNIAPLGAESYLFGWSIETFEPLRLRSEPNRYYNFNFGINYFYDFKNWNSLKIGSELIFTFRDQMEIAKVLNVKEIEFWFPPELTLYDYNIPIYAYDTYLDIGIAPYIQYNLLTYRRLTIGVKTKIYYFPKSGERIYNFGAVLSWNITNETKKNKIKSDQERKKYK